MEVRERHEQLISCMIRRRHAYAAPSWQVECRVIARVETGPQVPQPLYRHKSGGLAQDASREGLMRKGQAENLIKAHKLRVAYELTSRTKATTNQFAF